MGINWKIIQIHIVHRFDQHHIVENQCDQLTQYDFDYHSIDPVYMVCAIDLMCLLNSV